MPISPDSLQSTTAYVAEAPLVAVDGMVAWGNILVFIKKGEGTDPTFMFDCLDPHRSDANWRRREVYESQLIHIVPSNARLEEWETFFPRQPRE